MSDGINELRKARLAKGWSLGDLAERCGVTKQAVSSWELGDSTPSGSAMLLLAASFLLPLETVQSWFSRKAAA